MLRIAATPHPEHNIMPRADNRRKRMPAPAPKITGRRSMWKARGAWTIGVSIMFKALGGPKPIIHKPLNVASKKFR